DLAFDGGIVHIVDAVLTLPRSIDETARAAGITALPNALKSAGLDAVVEGLKDITVFAPSDAAFEAAAAGLKGLSAEQVAGALKGHVAQGLVYSTDVKDGAKLKTVGGTTLEVKVKDGAVWVGGKKVIKTDLLVRNGVVHVIDGIIGL
ncbi:beta-Ig-H3/fasciclin, partial [Trichodelitschia bisporula]